MKILVKAKPGSQVGYVKKIGERQVAVSVKQQPRNGRANEAIRKLLAKHFKIAQSRIKLISGHSSRQKLFEISP